MNLLLPVAWLLTAAGCLAWYLSSRHQRVLAQPLPAGAARFIGALLIVAALVLLFGSLQVPAAIYVHVTTLMLFLTLWPFVGVLARRGSRGTRETRAGRQ